MEPPFNVRPALTILTQRQMEEVHRYSLQILSSVGIRVDAESARRRLAQALGPAAVSGDRVLLAADLVAWALRAAPSTVACFDRRGRPAFRLPGETRFGIGVTALYYQDPETDQVAVFGRQHMQATVRLGEALPNFDVISTVGIVQDVPPHLSDLYGTLEMVANCTKPLVVLVSAEDSFPLVLDLLEQLHGDLAAKPFVLPYFNPISPLVINKGTSDKMSLAIQRGLPFIYSNYGMAGASTPITLGGMLAMLNAELLAGLTLSQLIKEGAPIILGSLPAFFDMRGMGSFYDATSYLVSLACAEMMDYYGLPHCGTSGSGVGWGPDLIAAGHQWMNHLLSCLGKVGLAPFVGDNLGSLAFSPAIAVYADEVISQVRRLARGFALDDESVALDEIAAVGPGGNYLTSSLTLKQFRQADHRSEVLPNLALEDWVSRGSPRAGSELRQHTRRLLDGASPPQDHEELLQMGERFISRAAACAC